MSKRLLAVVTCWSADYGPHSHTHDNKDWRVGVIIDTWYQKWSSQYRDAFDLTFFFGRPTNVQWQYSPSVVLDADDSYLGLPDKIRKLNKWAYDAGYNFIHKLDDDVFLHLPKLVASLPANDYSGFAIQSGDLTYASGTHYCLSRQAMKLVADAEIPEGEWREDRHVGAVLARNGIELTHNERFLCCDCDVCRTKYKDSISIHTTSAKRMYELMEASNGERFNRDARKSD